MFANSAYQWYTIATKKIDQRREETLWNNLHSNDTKPLQGWNMKFYRVRAKRTIPYHSSTAKGRAVSASMSNSNQCVVTRTKLRNKKKFTRMHYIHKPCKGMIGMWIRP